MQRVACCWPQPLPLDKQSPSTPYRPLQPHAGSNLQKRFAQTTLAISVNIIIISDQQSAAGALTGDGNWQQNSDLFYSLGTNSDNATNSNKSDLEAIITVKYIVCHFNDQSQTNQEAV